MSHKAIITEKLSINTLVESSQLESSEMKIER